MQISSQSNCRSCQGSDQIIDCNQINIPQSITRTFHYRIECKDTLRDCSRALTIDTTMWKYLIPLYIVVRKVLNHLGWNGRLERHDVESNHLITTKLFDCN